MNDPEIKEILTEAKVIAVVGISANPGLAGQALLGEVVYADLAAIPADIPVDMVDIFRRSEAVPEVVAEALAHLPALRTIWMQLGVMHEGAAAQARARGVRVVMDRCPKIDYPRLIGV